MSQIDTLYENLTQELRHELEKIAAFEEEKKQLEDFDYHLRSREKQLNTKQEEQEKKTVELASEREYITKQLKRLDELTELEKRIDGKRALLKQELVDIEKERESIKLEREVIKKKQEEVEVFEKEKEAFTKEKELFTEKNDALVKRREAVDSKEEAVHAEAGRLQRLAESWQLKKK